MNDKYVFTRLHCEMSCNMRVLYFSISEYIKINVKLPSILGKKYNK